MMIRLTPLYLVSLYLNVFLVWYVTEKDLRSYLDTDACKSDGDEYWIIARELLKYCKKFHTTWKFIRNNSH